MRAAVHRALAALPFVAALAAAPGASPAWADAVVHGVPLPRGTRSLATDLFESGQPFRKTVDFYRRFLKRQGLGYQEVPVYRVRGVAVARFVARDRAAAWLAIHVFTVEGRTRIFMVPAVAAPSGPPAPPPS